MRKTCKNHPKNEQKTHQKSSKNKSKKHTEKLTTQFQPKVRELLPKGGQKTTDKGGKGRDPGWNPPRKKKRILQKPDLLRGKGACWEGNTQIVTQAQHAPAVGRKTARGRILAPILAPFWHHFPYFLHAFFLHRFCIDFRSTFDTCLHAENIKFYLF